MKKSFLILAAVGLFVSGTAKADQNINQSDLIKISSIAAAPVSPFCKAIMQGDIDTVKKLIALGENVNKKSLGMTPAIFAARYNKAEILKLLIEKGADLTIRSDKGYSIKKHAELSNAKDVMNVLEAAM